MSDIQQPYTLSEAAAFLKISKSSLSRLLANGEIRYVKAGPRRTLIPADALQAYLAGDAR